MAIGLNNDYLRIAAGLLNYNNPYTIMMWVKPLNTGANGGIFALANGTGTNGPYDYSQVRDNGNLAVETYNGSWTWDSDYNDPLTESAWQHAALVRESNTSLRVFLNGVASAQATMNISGRAAIQAMILGAWPDLSSDRIEAHFAYCKAWSAALNATQIAAEMYYAAPQYSSSIYGWWLFATSTDLNDQSGNGHNWTLTGTLTTETGPTGITEPGGGGVSIPVVQQHLLQQGMR